MLWLTLTNHFKEGVNKDSLKDLILPIVLSNLIDEQKNEAIKKEVKKKLKFPNKIGKGDEFSNLIDRGWKVLKLYELAKPLLNAPNLTDSQVLNIWNTIGAEGNNPYIREVNGTKEEARAIFNILKGDRQLENPTHGVYYFDLLNNPLHRITYRESSQTPGVNSTIDFRGVGFRPTDTGGSPINRGEIKFFNP